MAKFAAAQLPPSDSITENVNGKVGVGDTDKHPVAMYLKVPVPISLDADQDAYPPKAGSDAGLNFSTTSPGGVSGIDDELSSQIGVPVGVLLGLPFFLQFHRVIIDYPNHLLILEKTLHSAKVVKAKVSRPLPNPGRAWPGYHWRPVGDGWVEVPDKEAQNKEGQSYLSENASAPITVTPATQATIYTANPRGGWTVTGPVGATVKLPDGTIVKIGPPSVPPATK